MAAAAGTQHDEQGATGDYPPMHGLELSRDSSQRFHARLSESSSVGFSRWHFSVTMDARQRMCAI